MLVMLEKDEFIPKKILLTKIMMQKWQPMTPLHIVMRPLTYLERDHLVKFLKRSITKKNNYVL